MKDRNETIARIAGNLLSGVPVLLLADIPQSQIERGVDRAVWIARRIADKVELGEAAAAVVSDKGDP